MIEFTVTEGDIADFEGDAIVNAANDHLWMGSGVAGALRRKGGSVIEKEALSKGPIEVGGAVETGAGRLKAKWVIHAAVMGQDLKTDPEKIRRAARSSMELATSLGAGSIAFPALGCGVGGIDPSSSADAIKRGILEAASGSVTNIRVYLVLFGSSAFHAFERVFYP